MISDRVTRRTFLTRLSGGAAGVLLTRAASSAQAGETGELRWYDVRHWGVEGRGWVDTERFYDRLPERAKGQVREPVWSLSKHSAGLCARFKTDALEIHVRYTLRSAELSLPHMPATGVSGVDLYAQDEHGAWRWISVVKPTAREMHTPLVAGLVPGLRAYTLYLPLYNGVETLEIGIDSSAHLAPVAPRSEQPIVFYGTSIVQGACASRPGMAFTSILGRRLHLPVINLGFSGNGRMEIELASLLGELDARVYLIDCLPNMAADLVAQRTEPFIRRLRELRPDAPIVLVEDRAYANSSFVASARRQNLARRAELARAYDRLRAQGFRDLYYVNGDELLGVDSEATTDGSHPNDLGMVRYADTLEPIIRQTLG